MCLCLQLTCTLMCVYVCVCVRVCMCVCERVRAYVKESKKSQGCSSCESKSKEDHL